MDVNPNICLTSNEECALRIVCWNIANSKRDNDFHNLIVRLLSIIATIRSMKPDVLIWLEARDVIDLLKVKRPFTEIALEIERSTGLVYAGTDYTNATGSSFGKAVFYNPERAYINKSSQRWTNELSPRTPSGDGFGNSITHLNISPVISGKIVINKSFSVGVVHLPMNLSSRIKICKYLRKYNRSDIVMGDFNTFPDDGGDEMMNILCSGDYSETLPESSITFRAFDGDEITIENSKLHKFPPSTRVVSKNEDGESITILPSSFLDHCLLRDDFQKKARVISSVYNGEHVQKSSDHYPIIADVIV